VRPLSRPGRELGRKALLPRWAAVEDGFSLAALFDYDNDGRLDLYLVQNGGPDSRSTNRLFHQEPDGRFTDVTAGSGLGVAGYGMGVAVGDVNNDGRPGGLRLISAHELSAARAGLTMPSPCRRSPLELVS
jgi:hypothetical protein